jgi:hypothetical protein
LRQDRAGPRTLGLRGPIDAAGTLRSGSGCDCRYATTKTGEIEYYIAPPAELEKLLVAVTRTYADLPKRDGKRRSIAFRKELPREVLKPWLDAWQQLGDT